LPKWSSSRSYVSLGAEFTSNRDLVLSERLTDVGGLAPVTIDGTCSSNLQAQFC
jgi:hypothetical protein